MIDTGSFEIFIPLGVLVSGSFFGFGPPRPSVADRNDLPEGVSSYGSGPRDLEEGLFSTGIPTVGLRAQSSRRIFDRVPFGSITLLWALERSFIK